MKRPEVYRYRIRKRDGRWWVALIAQPTDTHRHLTLVDLPQTTWAGARTAAGDIHRQFTAGGAT